MLSELEDPTVFNVGGHTLKIKYTDGNTITGRLTQETETILSHV